MFIFKKHPYWCNIFESWLEKYPNLDLSRLEKSFSLLLKYKNLLKHDITIDFAHSLLNHVDDTNRCIVEKFDDKIQEILHLKKKEVFINSLKTNKYQDLFNESVELELHSILDNKISIEALKHQFFNKLAKFKSSNDLLENLIQFKEKNIGWSREFYLNKIKKENLNVEVLDDQNGYMIVHAKDYEACRELGSQAWCIVQDKDNFLYYTNDLKRQIIALNFDLPIEIISMQFLI